MSKRRIEVSNGTRTSTNSLSNSVSNSINDNVDDIQSILDGIIGEDYIIKETGIRDLKQIFFLKLIIDTSIQSVYELSDLLPNLKKLVLDNSNIVTIRDLGIGLKLITSLSLSNCGLNDIDGIGALQSLEELSLSNNSIADVTPLAMHENIKTLDLSGNRLADISIGDALSSCPKLKTLNLSRNPINGVINYQLIMAALIPNIEVLDNNPVDPLAQSKVSNGMILEAASLLRVMEEELNDERRLEEELGIATKVFSSKSDSISRDSGKESSGSATIKTNGIFPDTGSELTHGSSVVLAGSMAAAMRKRREQLSSPNSRKLAPLHHMEEKESESTLDILDIARQWKSPGKQHATDDYSMFLKEGDITAAMTGKRSVSANFKGSKKGKDPFVINFDEIELPQSSSPLTSARSKNSARYKGMNDDSLEGPSSTRRPKSAVSDVSFDDRNYLSNSSSLHIQDVPLDMSRKKSVNSSFNSVEASPRQRNSSRGGSRPQSAISTAANFSSSTMSVPFKVSIDSNAANSEDVNIKNKNLKSGVQITPRGLSNYNSISVSSNLSGNSVDFEVEDEDADDMSWFQARGDIKKKAVNLNVTISDGNNDSSSKAVPASIVHRDIVRRTMFSNDGVDCSNEVDIIDDVDDEGESDVEDIAVNHVSRFRLMSASGNRSKPNNDKANKPWAGLSDQTKTANDEDSLTTDLLSPGIVKKPPIHRGNSKGLSNSSSKTTLSSMAGISLGFNLEGSLAAIDQWVKDMGSEEDDEDDDEIIPAAARSELPMRGLSRDSSLSGSSSRDISSKVIEKKEKILTRDTIVTMCSNSQREISPRFSSEQDTDDDNVLDSMRGSLGSPNSSNKNTGGKANIDLKVEKPIPIKSRRVLPSRSPRIVTSLPAETASAPLLDNTEVSPPRHEGTDVVGSKAVFGDGVFLTDAELVTLLKMPPKSTAVLRTRGSFQEYFRGISLERMKKLLDAAYSDVSDLSEKETKINKRMNLLTQASK